MTGRNNGLGGYYVAVETRIIRFQISPLSISPLLCSALPFEISLDNHAQSFSPQRCIPHVFTILARSSYFSYLRFLIVRDVLGFLNRISLRSRYAFNHVQRALELEILPILINRFFKILTIFFLFRRRDLAVIGKRGVRGDASLEGRRPTRRT